MERIQPTEDPAERQLFDTLKATYPFASAPEHHAMITQLRSQLPTIPSVERIQLIDDIENAVARTAAEDDDF